MEDPKCLGIIYYHPQTKFAKVMFLHVSVCPQSTWAGPPGQVHPPATVHAGIRSTSGRYVSHWNASCFNWFLVFSIIRLLKIWYEAQ